MDPFLLFAFLVCLCHTVLSVPGSLLVNCLKKLDLLALLCVVFPCGFGIWCPGSGVVLDCIAS